MRTNNVVVGLTVGIAALSLAAGCGGGSTLGTSDGGASGSSGSSGTSDGGSSGSSGTSGSSGGQCTEFHIGGQNDPGIGGAATSQVAAQAVADYAGVAQTQVLGVTAACKSLAVALGASTANQTSADAGPTARDRASAWCTLATMGISTAKGKAGGSLTLQFTPSACRLDVAKKLACQARCAGTAMCDGVTNPVVCTGGTLAGGFCTGGKLEGGCMVDAKCDGNCDVSVVAAADCPLSTVTVNVMGAADPSTAATLKSTIEANLPLLSALSAHFKVEADVAPVVTGNADAVADIKVACIPPVLSAAVGAVSDVEAGASASSSVLSAVQN
jgi:hypothetical protein